MLGSYLHFSDAAKFADVARNIVEAKGFGSDFAFFGSNIFQKLSLHLFPTSGILPVMPFSISIFFRIFGVSDTSVIYTSIFYFVLSLIFVYLLAKKVFNGRFVGLLSVLAVSFNYNLINYATSGASESPFIFEIVSSFYFLSLKRKWATALGFLLMLVMYFTRTQAFIYIAGLLLFYFLSRFGTKRAIGYFIGTSILAFGVDRFILPKLSVYYFYSVTSIGSSVSGQYLPGTAVSNALRGATGYASFLDIVKKIFYNLYNFYKLLPEIINPYFFALFVIGLFKLGKNKLGNSFNIAALFVFLVTFIVTAAGIPFFRYLHPVAPLVYIVACGTIFWISGWIFKVKKYSVMASLFLIIFFGMGQTLGVFLLDSRFERKIHNISKPPVYVLLSEKLKTDTNEDHVIVTNLDSWGSWYAERKTVWFPLEPKQLVDPNTGKIPFDAIYLTSYLMNDENYYMGDSWRQIFNNPDKPQKWTCDGCDIISKEFKVKNVYLISSTQDYERQDFSAVLLVKK